MDGVTAVMDFAIVHWEENNVFGLTLNDLITASLSFDTTTKGNNTKLRTLNLG